MDENTRYEPRFRPELRRQIGKRAWKVLGLIFLGTAAITLGLLFGFRDSRWYWVALTMSVIVVVLDVILLLQRLRQQRWMAQEFCMTEKGILVRGRRGRETLISWMAILDADRGTLVVSGQQSVPVIRCFLSVSAFDVFTTELRQTTLSRYFRRREDCFTLEYTSGRKWRIRSGRKQSRIGLYEAEPDFWYAFGKDLADYTVYWACVVVFAPVSLVFSVGVLIGEVSINSILLCVMMTAIWAVPFYFMFRPSLLFRTKLRLTPEGVYLQPGKKKTEFVPWEDVTEVGREYISYWSVRDVPCICCFKSPTAKEELEQCPKLGIRGIYDSDYNRRRDEIITMGYSSERMVKVRALHRAARQKK